MKVVISSNICTTMNRTDKDVNQTDIFKFLLKNNSKSTFHTFIFVIDFTTSTKQCEQG